MLRPLLLRSLRLAVALAIATTGVGAAAQSDNSRQVRLSTDADELVVSYSENPQMITNADKTPRIRVYADGRVLVHYPRYMKRAGTYETYLGKGELNQLVRSVAVLVEFDEDAARSDMNAVDDVRRVASGEVTYRSDAVVESFELNFAGYSESPAAPERAVSRQVKWKDIKASARTYPNMGEIRKLERAQASLLELLQRDDLIKLPPINTHTAER